MDPSKEPENPAVSDVPVEPDRWSDADYWAPAPAAAVARARRARRTRILVTILATVAAVGTVAGIRSQHGDAPGAGTTAGGVSGALAVPSGSTGAADPTPATGPGTPGVTPATLTLTASAPGTASATGTPSPSAPATVTPDPTASAPAAPPRTSAAARTTSRTTVTRTTGSADDAYVARIVVLVNAERTKRGLRPLTVSTCAAGYAKRWSTHMAQTGTFEHQGLGPILNNCGGRSAGENIAYGNVSADKMMNMWMNSEGHRANILNASYTRIGVGIARTSSGRVYGTQDFLGA